MKDYKELVNKVGKEKLLLMAAAGMVLIICSIPGKDEDQKESGTQTATGEIISGKESDSVSEYVEKLEARLADIIEKMDGVENVHVMITVKGSESKEILKDENTASENTSESDGEGGERIISSVSKDENTVYYKDSTGTETPYVLSEILPEIEGVAVVADGGENPAVKEKIINMIKALFGIEINKIMVTV